MNSHKAMKVAKIFLIGLVAETVFGFVVKGLWNALIPEIFGWHMITFWQAVGLIVLSKILSLAAFIGTAEAIAGTGRTA